MERPLAWRWATVIAVVLAGVLLVLSPEYGYHRDELYFRFLSGHPAWGYVDQPPLTPTLARLAVALFGDTVTALRVFPALAVAGLVVLIALIARELGGGRVAQVLAMLGVATGVYTLIAGHTLLTLSFDLPIWAAAILFMLKALLREQPRWWLAVGTVCGLATYNKHLIVMLLLGLAIGLLAAGPRRVLLSPWLWAGAAIAAALAVPNLLYQVTHDWPQLKMASALSENKGGELRVLFVPMQVLLFGPVVAVIGGFGWVRLWRDRRVRALAVAYPAAAVLTLAGGGRFDYTAGLILLLFTAGCVGVEAAG
ncbi:glycosyltransferase family 39 protein, partial [Nonomuraea sp. NPDC005983]|uniref:glycosyltransferase family 39 protein n=1 Tax=Nonomuraea sp. NPDC005983 TaxID=3155595 RepID=UPI00339E6F08